MVAELRQLSIDNGIDEYNMLQEIDRNEYGFTNEVKDMSFVQFEEWLIKETDIADAKNLPENWIPQTTYFLYVDDLPVGIARIRHYSSDFLEKQGVGNFGYGIARPYRGKGYGELLFIKILEKCKLHGYSKIKSFVHTDNIASNRIFIANGAKFVGTFNEIKNIYEIDIE